MEIPSPLENFGVISNKLEELEIVPENQALQRIPVTTATFDLWEAKKVLRLLERLEEDEDVQNVYHNLKVTPELEVALSG